MNYIVFDMEWNKSKLGDYMIVNRCLMDEEILQIGAVKLDNDLNDIDDFNIQVKAQYLTKLHGTVADVTNLRQEDLEDGVSFPEAAAAFREWCGEDFVLCSWGENDLEVLLKNLQAYEMDDSWVPETYNLQKLYDLQTADDHPHNALLSAVHYFEEDAFPAHDALNDAENTVTVFWHLDLENLQNCRVPRGRYRGNGSYVLMDGRWKNYTKVDDILNDWSVRYFHHPKTQERIVCRKLSSVDVNNYCAWALDKDGVQYLFLFRVTMKKGGRIWMDRRIYLLEEYREGLRQNFSRYRTPEPEFIDPSYPSPEEILEEEIGEMEWLVAENNLLSYETNPLVEELNLDPMKYQELRNAAAECDEVLRASLEEARETLEKLRERNN